MRDFVCPGRNFRGNSCRALWPDSAGSFRKDRAECMTGTGEWQVFPIINLCEESRNSLTAHDSGDEL